MEYIEVRGRKLKKVFPWGRSKNRVDVIIAGLLFEVLHSVILLLIFELIDVLIDVLSPMQI